MTKEDYFKYYIQGSDHYLIPKDVFKELFNEMINWKEESQKQKEVIDKVIDFIENGDLLYLATKNSLVYRNNVEVRAVADRLNDLLQILEDNRTYKNRKREEI